MSDTDDPAIEEHPKGRPKVVAIGKKKAKQTPAENFLSRMDEWKHHFETEGKDSEYIVIFTDTMRVSIGIDNEATLLGIYEMEKDSFLQSIQPRELVDQ